MTAEYVSNKIIAFSSRSIRVSGYFVFLFRF
jgi:hypothetical protein